MTGFHVHRGVLASFHRRPLPQPEAVLAAANRVAICEDVNNHTNLGAIFRAAAGLGIDAVLLSPSCADPLYRRSVRVSMGEVFAVPYARLAPWPAALERVREAGFSLLALTPAADAVPLQSLAPAHRVRPALLLGAEGAGLSPAALAASEARVAIPMRRGVDSLNVAAAAAVAFWELEPGGPAPRRWPTFRVQRLAWAIMATVLVAEADQDLRDLVAFKLVQAGFDVIAVADGPAALSAAQEQTRSWRSWTRPHRRCSGWRSAAGCGRSPPHAR